MGPNAVDSRIDCLGLVRARCGSSARRASRTLTTEPVRRRPEHLVSALAHRGMRWWHMERQTLGCMLVALSLVAGMPGATYATESEGPCSDWGHPDFWRLNALAEVQRCLAAGEDVNMRDEWGATPLHFAASLQPAATVKHLLAEGAKVGMRNVLGAHPLHYAATNPDRDVASLLVGAGAEVDGQDEYNQTPLHWAAEGTVEVATVLLAAGARLEARNFRGESPLHHSAAYGNAAVATMLLSAGAKVEGRDNAGATPLHAAARGDNGEAGTPRASRRSWASCSPPERTSMPGTALTRPRCAPPREPATQRLRRHCSPPERRSRPATKKAIPRCMPRQCRTPRKCWPRTIWTNRRRRANRRS